MTGPSGARGLLATLAACVLASAIALSAGCGVKSAPLPPSAVRPARITDLLATPDPYGVKLTWRRPMSYTNGRHMRDLGGFVVVRAEAKGPFAPLVELPVTDQERFSVERVFSYIDDETVLGHHYRYAIISKTLDGYTSDPSNEVAFTRIKSPSSPNPNFFELPSPSPLPTGG
jgi:hypothetical protein